MINLEKIEKKAPELAKLAKSASISLEKKGISEHKAKVALCLDISGSMSNLYRNGSVQRLAEKILALGCNFDDDGSIDIFLFGTGAYEAGELTIDNYKDGIKGILKRFPLEGSTHYGKVMSLIRKFYFPESKKNNPNKSDKPVYVMFLTDGATQDESVTEKEIKESSYEAIFWQFLAIGKSSKGVVPKKGLAGLFQKIVSAGENEAFTFLENLDNLGGRYIDNANFFSLEDLDSMEESELYEKLMAEYPDWMKKSQEMGLL